MAKRLYVGNLGFGATADDLKALFETYGRVHSAQVQVDRETGKSRGFGFVLMDDDGEAEEAIYRIDGTEHFGRRLNVNEAQAKAPPPPRGRPGPGYGPGHRFGPGPSFGPGPGPNRFDDRRPGYAPSPIDRGPGPGRPRRGPARRGPVEKGPGPFAGRLDRVGRQGTSTPPDEAEAPAEES